MMTTKTADFIIDQIERAARQGRADGFRAGLEAAARFMLSRNVSASEFYAAEIRKLHQQRSAE